MADEKKYLDKTGLTNLVGKIKSELSKKANTEDVQPKGEYATLVDGTVPASQLPSYVDDVVEFSGFTLGEVSAKAMSTTKTSQDLLCRVQYVAKNNVFVFYDGKDFYSNWGDANTWGTPTTGTFTGMFTTGGRQPESGKIYVDTTTGKTYRWSGSSLVEISASLALGETSETAFAGDRGVAVEKSLETVKSELSKKANAEDVESLSNDVKVNTASLEAKSVTSISTKMVGDVLNIVATKINGDEPTSYVRPATTGTTGLMSAEDKNKLDNTIFEEDKRQIAEKSRVETETSRVAAEQSRVRAENERDTNEDSRVSAEQTREQSFTTKVGEVDTAIKNCNTATEGAERVDATITEANVLQVTDRNGTQKTLDLAAVVKANSVAEDVDRIKESMGAYSDRPDITLTAKENNVAISTDGVKVSKSGWAIAEFTAEKGNEYLFKPNVIDGSVCIFAEKIDKVEKRGIDYTYTYNENGTIATATATYLGKTHIYTYSYTTADSGATDVAITDETGAVVTELPYQYLTTVGSYSPLVRLNAGAELPKDGYCRFMSHFQGNNSLKVAVSYKVGTADLTMKVVRDGVMASISTQLGNISQKENETRSLVMDLKTAVDTFVDKDGYVGMARMNGDASGDAETTYGTAEKIHTMGAKFRLCTVKNGKITHRCAPGRLTLDENGEEVKIDGTDGDVMLCVEDGLNLLKATKDIGGREMNIIGIGDRKSVWYGVQSKEIPAFGFTPCATVNAKILDDVRSQAHCVYNTTAMGSYANALDYKIFKDVYKKSGGGYASKQFSSVLNIQYAQNKNEDNLTCKPYMGLHFEYMECLLAMMFSEIGSVCHTNLDMFGVGITNNTMSASLFNDDAISGVSGWKFITADGTEKYQNWWTNVYTGGQTATATELVRGIVGNDRYLCVEMLEAQRVLDAVMKAGLADRIGSKSNIFHYDENGDMVCTSDGSVNLDTGEGMEACKHYFVIRNVPRCEGLADGVMTAVINSYTKLECCDGLVLNDKTTDMTGGIAIMKRSLPIYRGWTLPYIGVFRHLNYGYYVIRVDTEGVVDVEYDAIEVKDVKPLTVLNNTAYEASGKNSTVPMLEGASKVYQVGKGSGLNGEFWTMKSNYSMGLFCLKQRGGGFRTHENAYLWLYSTNNHGNDSVQVHGSVSGCSAYDGRASVRTAACYNHAGAGDVSYAGAFAVQL